jgi:hypothetical protein
MRREDDSVSTFYHGNTINLTENVDEDQDADEEIETISKIRSPVSILRTSKNLDSDAMSRTSTSDSASRISSLEIEISAMDNAFRTEIGKLQEQAISQAKSQLLHGSMLTEILGMLKNSNLNNETSTSAPPDAANPTQASDAGDSLRVAGSE